MSTLTDAQVAEYNDQGFLLVKGFVPRDEVERIREDVNGLHEKFANSDTPKGVGITWEDLPDNVPPRIRQLMGSQHVSENIRRIAESDKMRIAMTQLLGSPVELFHSKLMMKAARQGSFTPWHADWGYWLNDFTEPTQMNAFMSIDPSTLENGCIRYVPGSHRKFIEHQKFDSKSGFAIGLPGDIDAYDAVPVEMEPGDVTFHGSLTIHASEGNRSAHSRIMNTFAYNVVGTRT